MPIIYMYDNRINRTYNFLNIVSHCLRIRPPCLLNEKSDRSIEGPLAAPPWGGQPIPMHNY